MALDIESFFSNLDHDLLKKAWMKMLGLERLPDDHYNVFRSATHFSYILYDDLRMGKSKQSGLDEKHLANLRSQGIEAFFENPAAFKNAIKNREIRVYKNQRHNEAPKGQRKKRGIPQGLPISAVLANIYMLDFDRLMLEEVVRKRNGYYRRYSDDIVIVCDKQHFDKIKNLVQEQICNCLLRISTAKTEVSFFESKKVGKGERLQVSRILQDGTLRENVPFNYLGFEFYGYQTLIKSSNLSKFYRRMIRSVKTAKKRSLKVQEEERLFETPPLFLRKIFKQFSPVGSKPKKYPAKRTVFEKNEFGIHRPNRENFTKRYRGNFFTYAKKAADTMEEPKIIQQMRSWKRILFSAMKKDTSHYRR
jgi:hypothetical protein